VPTVTYQLEPGLAPEEFIDVLVPRCCFRCRSIRSARPSEDGTAKKVYQTALSR